MPELFETSSPEPITTSWRYIQDALRDLRFGVVTIIVQDGVVIQIERTEKRRLPRKKISE